MKKNPSAASRSQLFAWLKSEGFTLTTSGLIIGYKGVSDDFKSISAGKEPVTVAQAARMARNSAFTSTTSARAWLRVYRICSGVRRTFTVCRIAPIIGTAKKLSR